MARSKPKWGPGEVQMYEEMGTTSDVTTCGFCGIRGLEETAVLLVHNADGDLAGNMYACDACAAQAAPRHARSSGSWSDDPRLSTRRRRR
jgi:hypothetical protein